MTYLYTYTQNNWIHTKTKTYPFTFHMPFLTMIFSYPKKKKIILLFVYPYAQIPDIHDTDTNKQPP